VSLLFPHERENFDKAICLLKQLYGAGDVLRPGRRSSIRKEGSEITHGPQPELRTKRVELPKASEAQRFLWNKGAPPLGLSLNEEAKEEDVWFISFVVFKNEVMETAEPFDLQCYCIGSFEIVQH
jgi:hypothetical protein